MPRSRDAKVNKALFYFLQSILHDLQGMAAAKLTIVWGSSSTDLALFMAELPSTPVSKGLLHRPSSAHANKRAVLQMPRGG